MPIKGESVTSKRVYLSTIGLLTFLGFQSGQTATLSPNRKAGQDQENITHGEIARVFTKEGYPPIIIHRPGIDKLHEESSTDNYALSEIKNDADSLSADLLNPVKIYFVAEANEAWSSNLPNARHFILAVDSPKKKFFVDSIADTFRRYDLKPAQQILFSDAVTNQPTYTGKQGIFDKWQCGYYAVQNLMRMLGYTLFDEVITDESTFSLEAFDAYANMGAALFPKEKDEHENSAKSENAASTEANIVSENLLGFEETPSSKKKEEKIAPSQHMLIDCRKNLGTYGYMVTIFHSRQGRADFLKDFVNDQLKNTNIKVAYNNVVSMLYLHYHSIEDSRSKLSLAIEKSLIGLLGIDVSKAMKSRHGVFNTLDTFFNRGKEPYKPDKENDPVFQAIRDKILESDKIEIQKIIYDPKNFQRVRELSYLDDKETGPKRIFGGDTFRAEMNKDYKKLFGSPSASEEQADLSPHPK